MGLTRRMIPLCTGFFAGLFLSYMLCVSGPLELLGFGVLAAAAAGLCLLSLGLREPMRARAVVFCAAFAAATAFSALRTSLRLVPLERLDGETVEITGKIVSITGGDRGSFVVSGRVAGIPAKAVVYSAGFDASPGDTVSLESRVSELENTPFFRARDYWLPDGVYLSASASGPISVTRSGRGVFDIIRGYSARVSLNIRRYSDEAGGFLAAMITGDRASYSDADRLALNRSGIGHLAAVSGLHVGVLAAAASAVLRKLRSPRWLEAVLCEALVAGFIVFSGLRTSAIRAVIMISVLILSRLAKRRADPLNSVCICALLMTVSNPYSAAGSSLCLSLAGVTGVAVMSPALSRALGLRGKFAKSLCASVCASAATAPFVALWFNELSLIAPLTNLAAVPVCSAALILGMAYALTGCAFTFLIRAAGALCGAVLKLATLIAGLRFCYIPLGSALAAALIGTSAVLSVAIWLIKKRPKAAALTALFMASAVICLFGAETAASQNRLVLTIIGSGGDSALVLRKGAECIIIDFGGGMASEAETVVVRFGLTSLRALAVGGGGEAAASAYSAISLPPEKIYTADMLEINAFGAEIDVSESGADIDFNGEKTVFRTSEAASGGELNITFLGGLCVINGGDTEILRGDILKNFVIG